MGTGKKFLRWLIILVAALALVLSVAGIVGAWWAHNIATNATLRAFSIVDTAVGVADAGANRAFEMVERGRTEVQQVESTIVTIGEDIQANRPLLTALSSRVDERLTPVVDQLRTVLAPITGTLRAVRALVDFVNAFPFIRETPPAVAELEAALSRLDEAVADVRQVNDTIRAAVTGTADRFTGESVSLLTGLTGRVDSRLVETQASVQAVQAELTALQARMAVLRARLLLIYNLTAAGLTLFFLWVIYSQVVLIRHQRLLLRKGGEAAPEIAPPAAAPELSPASSAPLSAPAPVYPPDGDAAQ
jgi:hypothetical protein